MIVPLHRFRFSALARVAIPFVTTCVAAVASAQTANTTVHWEARLEDAAALAPGRTAPLAVSAQIQPGWHVYALSQGPGGPTPLRVTVEDNDTVATAGIPRGPDPETQHDPGFDLDTAFYTRAFAVQVPVTVRPSAIPGRRVVTVSIHFQSCSDRECLPPTTVHVAVPVYVSAGA